MIEIPNLPKLKRIAQSLATLDLINEPEWQYRYYSYNSRWSDTEQMASMRNGCGDEWFLLFDSDGNAGLKGLAHEAPAALDKGLSERLQAGVPVQLAGFAEEPAFRWDSTSFCFWWLKSEEVWIEPSEQEELETGANALLSILSSGASGYQEFACEYFERDLDVSVIDRIFEHEPLTPSLASEINPDASMPQILDDLKEIRYPH
tara:strand:- start:7294 stop:7905 length:612 start_codon:yes stop_codon:yes gene_type:complete